MYEAGAGQVSSAGSESFPVSEIAARLQCKLL
jgi:hypothetical protein